ncbi:lactadherin-like, partial [Anneissia japonica]|uniref:lactadherin-like n=1 Tax=Anneissia japonica TaxID=1529436 RepID=UPI00142580F4
LCIDPFGVEDGTIPDEQLSASSEYSFWSRVQRGRLNTKEDRLGAGAWCTKTKDQYQWIQVDLGKLHKVHGVITQGRNKCCLEWVTSYEIFYSVDDSKVFNNEQNSSGSCIRCAVECMMAVEYKCFKYGGESLYITCSNSGNVDSLNIMCIDPLGIEDGTIPAEQLSASSENSSTHAAHRGRLNTEVTGLEQGAWSSGTLDQNQWIQVDLGKLHKVQGVITQGRNDNLQYRYLQWVTSYEIFYSSDGNLFQPIRNSYCQVTRFVGNSDQDTNVTNIFPGPVYTQFVWHGYISLRFEVLGCSAGPMCSELGGRSTYYKSFRRNPQCSVTTKNSKRSCIRCAVKCMRALGCKYFKYDGECHIYTCSNNDYFVAFQYNG